MPWSSGIHRAEGVIQGAFHSPLNSGIFFIKSNGMNRFSLVGLTGMFTLEYFHWSGHFGRLDQNVPYHLTKFLFPVPFFCILLTSTITECMLFKSTVEPQLSGLFDYLDLFPWSQFLS